jgi:threonine dehydratase
VPSDDLAFTILSRTAALQLLQQLSTTPVVLLQGGGGGLHRDIALHLCTFAVSAALSSTSRSQSPGLLR